MFQTPSYGEYHDHNIENSIDWFKFVSWREDKSTHGPHKLNWTKWPLKNHSNPNHYMILWSLQFFNWQSGTNSLRDGHWSPLGSRWWFGISGNLKVCATERRRKPLSCCSAFLFLHACEVLCVFLSSWPLAQAALPGWCEGRQAGISRLQLWPWAQLPNVTVKENVNCLKNLVLPLSWLILSLCESRGRVTIWHKMTLVILITESLIIITAKHEKGEKNHHKTNLAC